jgi:hypothetical protein
MKRLLSKLLPARPAGPGQLQREGRELRRLETLIDVVFAIDIVVILMVCALSCGYRVRL